MNGFHVPRLSISVCRCTDHTPIAASHACDSSNESEEPASIPLEKPEILWQTHGWMYQHIAAGAHQRHLQVCASEEARWCPDRQVWVLGTGLQAPLFSQLRLQRQVDLFALDQSSLNFSECIEGARIRLWRFEYETYLELMFAMHASKYVGQWPSYCPLLNLSHSSTVIHFS